MLTFVCSYIMWVCFLILESYCTYKTSYHIAGVRTYMLLRGHNGKQSQGQYSHLESKILPLI
jgi:hypothetical protein